MSEPQGIDREKLSLRAVRCDTWAGFVFVCLDAKAEPLIEYLGIVPEHLAPYGFENCQRGLWDTKSAAHRAGDPVKHLYMMSYGLC